MTFASSGKTFRLDYTDNANTSVNLPISPCGAVYIFSSADSMVNFGTSNATATTYFLADGANTTGTFLLTGVTVLALPNFAANSGEFYVSVSSDTAGYIMVTPGSLV